jgi:hypothetical protein
LRLNLIVKQKIWAPVLVVTTTTFVTLEKNHTIFLELRFLNEGAFESCSSKLWKLLVRTSGATAVLLTCLINWATRQDSVGRKGTLTKYPRTLAIWISRFYWPEYSDNRLFIWKSFLSFSFRVIFKMFSKYCESK